MRIDHDERGSAETRINAARERLRSRYLLALVLDRLEVVFEHRAAHKVPRAGDAVELAEAGEVLVDRERGGVLRGRETGGVP